MCVFVASFLIYVGFDNIQQSDRPPLPNTSYLQKGALSLNGTPVPLQGNLLLG